MANNADAIDLMNEVHGARHIVKVLTNKVAELEKKNERLRDKVVLEWEEKCAEIALLKGKLTLSGTARALAAEHQLRVERARNDSALMKLVRKNERLRAITLEQAYEIGLLKGRIEAALALL